MLGTYRPKVTSTTNNKPVVKTTKSRATIPQKSETGPKTRSASSRRPQEPPVTITYIGRSRTASDSDLSASSSATSSARSRRPLSSTAKKTPSELIPSEVKGEDHSNFSSSSFETTSLSSASQCAEFLETVNQIGVVAKRDSKYIRRLKLLNSRYPNNWEKEVANDETLTLIAIQMLTNRNIWSLNSCHAYLPTIIDNITSEKKKNRSIALDGLDSIANTFLERIKQFAGDDTRKIGVDIVAEERTEKAKECIKYFRDIVRTRDKIYKLLNEESVYKLDLILAQLKKA